jgi:hypothetical protein
MIKLNNYNNIILNMVDSKIKDTLEIISSESKSAYNNLIMNIVKPYAVFVENH